VLSIGLRYLGACFTPNLPHVQGLVEESDSEAEEEVSPPALGGHAPSD
jgi:hypothetical protein